MNELLPFGFAAVGKFLDGLTTSLYCDKYGTDEERGAVYRKLMNDHGVWESFPLRQLVSQGKILGTGAVLYVIDGILGIENELINFHKSWLYGMGGLTYIAAINNSLCYITRGARKRN